MNNFILKLNLFLVGVVLFVGCSIFILLNHGDTIEKFVPAEAEAYLHIDVPAAQTLNTEKKDHFYNWLEAKSTLDSNSWKELLSKTKTEIGFFSINGQIFAISKANRNLNSYLSENNVSFVKKDDIIYVPALHLSEKSLINEEWYQKTKEKISFSDFVIYSKDLAKIEKTIPLLKTPTLYPLAGFGNIHKDYLELDVKGQVGQAKTKLTEANIKHIPANTSLYLRNIDTKTLNLLKTPGENLEFSIISLVNGPIEYLNTENGSILYANKGLNTLNDLKSKIINTIGLLYPIEKEVELPDGSTGIHLVADTSIAKYFVQNQNTWKTRENVEDIPFDFELSIQEEEEQLIVTLNTPLVAKATTQKCNFPKFRKASGLYLTTSQENWGNILIQNKNQTKISICID